MYVLHWEAFGAKLRHVLGPEQKALRFLADQLNPDYALIAQGSDGGFRGVAGYKTALGPLVGGTLRDLAGVYGWASACWRRSLLGLVERNIENGTLLMDGVCVGSGARGMGLGTALLRAIKNEALALGLSSVRLDVIDSNPRARALYERDGFILSCEETLGPFPFVFGFRSSTRMR